MDDIIEIDKFLGDNEISKLVSKLTNNNGNGDKVPRNVILRGNCIGTSGAQSISDMITLGCLKSLSLEWNSIGSTGAACIGRALEDDSTLTHLDLRNNGITDEGAVSLSKSLRNNTTLTSLDLRWNSISDKGAVSFRDALLERNPPIILQISGNALNTSTILHLEQWSQRQSVFVKTVNNSSNSNGNSNGNGNSSSLMGPLMGLEKENMMPVQLSSNDNVSTSSAADSLLRQQCSTVQSICQDLQRQLDSSAKQITELEQKVLKEEFRNNQLDEQLKYANGRLSDVLDEQKTANFSMEQRYSEMTLEMKRISVDKEVECKAAFAARDQAKDMLRKQSDDYIRLKDKFDALISQTVTDREGLSCELTSALNSVTDLSIQLTKVSTENTSLKAVIERSVERVGILESELEKGRREGERMLKVEIERRDEEIGRLKDDYLRLSNDYSSKSMQQRMQISDLTTRLSSLDSTFAQERLDLKKAADDAISGVMQSEQKKYESLQAEAKKAMDSFLSSNHELESRCNGYIAEITSLRDEHGRHIDLFKAQLESLENELKRVRHQNISLKDASSATTSESAAMKRELDDTKKRLLISLEESEDCHRTLQDAIVERQELRSRIDRLSSELEHAAGSRSREFELIAQTIALSMEKEFQSLKVNMKIRDRDK